jgi:hypothetical protein
MSQEREPRLSFGQRLGVAGGFLVLGAGGAATVGLGLENALHASSKQGVHASAAELGHYQQEQSDAGWVALGGVGMFAAGVGGAAYFARGAYDRFMRTEGQWAWEVPAATSLELPMPAPEMLSPVALPDNVTSINRPRRAS